MCAKSFSRHHGGGERLECGFPQGGCEVRRTGAASSPAAV